MPIPATTQLSDTSAIKRFFGSIVRERFFGYVDFDFEGKKRRLFFADGRVFSAQSAVPGENLADQLLAERQIDDAKHAQALALARQRKLPLEAALVTSGVEETVVLSSLANLCEKLVRACVAESGGSAKATENPALHERMKGDPQDLIPMLSEPVVVAEDPVRAEIRAAHQAFEGKDHYQVLDVPVDAPPDLIKKRYFELAKKWHTDNFAKHDLGETKELIDQLFGRISDAFTLLSDADKRKEYDTLRDRKARGLPTEVKDIMLAEQMFHRGEALLKRNEFAAALKEMSEAKTINPGEAEFWAGYGLALFLAQPDHAKDAIAAVQQALTLQPKLARGFEALGRIYKALGDVVKAKHNFEKCLQLEPKNISAQREIRLINMRKESGKHAPVDASEGGFFQKLFKK